MTLSSTGDSTRSRQSTVHLLCGSLLGWRCREIQMRRPQSVRLNILAAGILAIACSGGGSARADFSPYEARVVASGASVRSGPGDKYYATDTLAEGDVVEIYREKPGGWLAIRPPKNSFSWIAGKDLTLRDGGLAEVNKEGVASRIGSRLSDKHNASQVRLKKGEVVEVLDHENVNGETWYKISPPAGEFRWIQSALVERVGPIKQASAEAPIATKSTNSEAKTPPASTAAATDAVAPPLLPRTWSATPSAASPPAAAPPITPLTPIPVTPAPAAPAAAASANSTTTPSAPRRRHTTLHAS